MYLNQNGEASENNLGDDKQAFWSRDHLSLPCNTEFGEAHYQDQEGEACELDSLHSSHESAQWHNAYSGDTDRPYLLYCKQQHMEQFVISRRRERSCVPFRLTLITEDDRKTRHSRRRP